MRSINLAKSTLAIVSLMFGMMTDYSLSGRVGHAYSQAAWNIECRQLRTQYGKKPRHKAFALTGRTASAFGCVAAWGRKSKAAAERDALAYCKRKYGKCYISQSE